MAKKACCYGLTEFDFDEERDLRNYRAWLCDFAHTVPPLSPLYAWAWHTHCAHGHDEHEYLSMPAVKGLDWRMIDGISYLAVMEAKPEEIPKREKIFRERIAPYIEDFETQYNKLISRMGERFEQLKARALNIETASNLELLDLFGDFLVADREQWRVHMRLMLSCYAGYNLFELMTRELLEIGSPDPLFQKLMGGFDSTLFRSNKEFWRLGNRAVELGLDGLFRTIENNEELLKGLEESDAGRKWLGEYRQFLGVYGWRCMRQLEWSTPTWLEKPSLGLPSVKVAIAKAWAYTLDEERERLAKQREEAEKEVLARVPEEQKRWFALLMEAAQMSGWFSEDHGFHLDMPFHAMGRWITKEYGRRFAQVGAIDDPQDVYFLMPGEIRKSAIAMERNDLRPYAEMRKREWGEYCKVVPQPVYGDVNALPELTLKTVVISVNIGMPIVKPELKADLYGALSSPGVAEGIARVVMSEDRLAELQAGEILIAPATSAPWTPAFGIAAGVVIDGGGALCHALIVAREFGIPAVVGTMEATQQIKTGQRIRIDGNLGVVYILE